MSDYDDSPVTTLNCVYNPDDSERPTITTMTYIIGVVHFISEDEDYMSPVRTSLTEPNERRHKVSIVSFGNLGTLLGHPRKSPVKELSPPGGNKSPIQLNEVDSFRTRVSEPIENPQSLDCETKIKWLREYMWSFYIIDNGGIDDGAAHMGLSALTDNDYFRKRSRKYGFSFQHTPTNIPGYPDHSPGESPLFRDAFRKYAECLREL